MKEPVFLRPPGQPRKLAETMLRMLNDGELRNRVIAAGKQRVVREFDNRQLIRELAEVYRGEGMERRA